MIKITTVFLCVLLFSADVFSSDFMYGSKRVAVEVNNEAHTLIHFPSVPIGMNCQPERVLDIRPVGEEDIAGFAQKSVSRSYLKKQVNKKGKTATLNSLLIMAPMRKHGLVDCSFMLENEDEINVSFSLKKDTFLPIVSFKNEFSSAGEVKQPYTVTEQYRIMKSFYKSGKPSGFVERNIRGLKALKKENAIYKFSYMGTNGKSYEVWRLSVKALRAFKIPKWEGIKPNTVFMSAWLSKNKKSKDIFKKGDSGFLLLLKKKDTPYKYILNLLP